VPSIAFGNNHTKKMGTTVQHELMTIKHHKESNFVCVMPTFAAMTLDKLFPIVKDIFVAIVKKE
jgi:hypothetical protein